MDKPSRSLVLWRCYSGILAAVAVSGVLWALRLDTSFFWQLVWAATAWMALAALSLALMSPRERGVLWWTTLICNLLNLILWAALILVEYGPESDPWQQIARTILGLSYIASIYLCALLFIRHIPRGGRWMKVGRVCLRIVLTVLALAFMAMIAIIHINTDIDQDHLFLAITLPTILLTVVILWLPAAASMDALQQIQTLPHHSTMLGQCPSCGTQQPFAQGGVRCIKCGLRVNIEFQEPRCACGYLLYNLPGPRCPECGRDIASGVITPAQAP